MLSMILFTTILNLADGNQSRVLDLTRSPEMMVPAIAPRNIQNCRPRGRGDGQLGGVPPFTIEMMGVDRSVYSMGGPIVVDLSLTNTSGRSLPIPTVFVDQFVDPFEGEDAVQFGLGIVLKDANGQEHDVAGTALRGSTKIPYTTQPLGPGETIKIHFPGVIVIGDSPSAPSTGEVELMASLLITDGECRMWTPIRTKSTVKVRFVGH